MILVSGCQLGFARQIISDCILTAHVENFKSSYGKGVWKSRDELMNLGCPIAWKMVCVCLCEHARPTIYVLSLQCSSNCCLRILAYTKTNNQTHPHYQHRRRCHFTQPTSPLGQGSRKTRTRRLWTSSSRIAAPRVW